MAAKLAAFRSATFVGVFISHDTVTGKMPRQWAIKEVLHARGGDSPAGLFPKTAASVRASRRDAWEQSRRASIRYKYHTQPN